MKIDASARAALRKRKQQLKNLAVSPAYEQVDEARTATRDKLQKLITDSAKPSPDLKELVPSIASEIEEQLFEDSEEKVDAKYRAGFRRLFTCLRDSRAGFANMLIAKDISGREFAKKPADELKRRDQLEKESQIKKENIDRAIGQTMLPETIQQIKDGRDREKWGVSRSAAAIDD